MRLALNLIFRILPFRKGRFFFTLRYLFFQWTPFVTTCTIVMFFVLQKTLFFQTQWFLLLSLYMLLVPPQKQDSPSTFSRYIKPFLTVNFVLLIKP